MTWKKFLIGLVLAFISFGIGAYYRFNVITIPIGPIAGTRPGTHDPASTDLFGVAVSDDLGESDGQEIPEKLEIAGRINLLVLGEDNIDSVKRSDTMLFVAIDIDEKNVRVLSLPRDTRVAIPRRGNQKLNHAYAYGGVDLLRATIERFLGTTIHYYVKVDYDNFPRLVDIVGGVDIFVGKAMKYTDRKQKLYIDIPQGKQRMNGETALKYVRFRNDAMGDIGRIRRQQQFLKAFLHRLYETENLFRFPTILEEIKNTLTTDLEPSSVLQLGYFVRKLESEQNRIFFKMLPGEAAMIDGLSYWVADPAGIESFLLADIEGLMNDDRKDVTTAAEYSSDSPDGLKKRDDAKDAVEEFSSTSDVQRSVGSITQAVAILNGTGKGGIAQTISTHLQKMGVDVTHVGNAKHFDYRSSIVIYPENASAEMKASAENLARLCGIPSNLIRPDKQAIYASLIVGHNYASLIKRLENSYAMIQQE